MHDAPEDIARNAIELINRLSARVTKLRAAVELFQSFGCPVCSGDCASANPPVMNCPMQTARDALKVP